MVLPLQVYTDYMERKHVAELVNIANAVAPQAHITEGDVLADLSDQYTTGRVAVGLRDELLGGIIYDLQRQSINILQMWLNPTLTVEDSKVVAEALLEKLMRKVRSGDRTLLRFAARECLTGLLQVLAQLGFRGIKVLRDYYMYGPNESLKMNEDAIVVVFDGK
jgi:hypothetical protein